MGLKNYNKWTRDLLHMTIDKLILQNQLKINKLVI